MLVLRFVGFLRWVSAQKCCRFVGFVVRVFGCVRLSTRVHSLLHFPFCGVTGGGTVSTPTAHPASRSRHTVQLRNRTSAYRHQLTSRYGYVYSKLLPPSRTPQPHEKQTSLRVASHQLFPSSHSERK